MGKEIESVASALGCGWYAITMVGSEDLPKPNKNKRKRGCNKLNMSVLTCKFIYHTIIWM